MWSRHRSRSIICLRCLGTIWLRLQTLVWPRRDDVVPETGIGQRGVAAVWGTACTSGRRTACASQTFPRIPARTICGWGPSSLRECTLKLVCMPAFLPHCFLSLALLLSCRLCSPIAFVAHCGGLLSYNDLSARLPVVSLGAGAGAVCKIRTYLQDIHRL